MSVEIDGLANAVMGALNDYKSEINEGTKKAVKEVAKECLSEIKKASPVRAGKTNGSYKKGWREKVEYDGADDTRIIVHNKTDYQLTHLLEYGHAKRGGVGRVQAIPHIGPAEKNAAEKLQKEIEVVVKR